MNTKTLSNSDLASVVIPSDADNRGTILGGMLLMIGLTCGAVNFILNYEAVEVIPILATILLTSFGSYKFALGCDKRLIRHDTRFESFRSLIVYLTRAFIVLFGCLIAVTAFKVLNDGIVGHVAAFSATFLLIGALVALSVFVNIGLFISADIVDACIFRNLADMGFTISSNVNTLGRYPGAIIVKDVSTGKHYPLFKAL